MDKATRKFSTKIRNFTSKLGICLNQGFVEIGHILIQQSDMIMCNYYGNHYEQIIRQWSKAETNIVDSVQFIYSPIEHHSFTINYCMTAVGQKLDQDCLPFISFIFTTTILHLVRPRWLALETTALQAIQTQCCNCQSSHTKAKQNPLITIQATTKGSRNNGEN